MVREWETALGEEVKAKIPTATTPRIARAASEDKAARRRRSPPFTEELDEGEVFIGSNTEDMLLG
jgi:hypothetical protein